MNQNHHVAVSKWKLSMAESTKFHFLGIFGKFCIFVGNRKESPSHKIDIDVLHVALHDDVYYFL